MKKNDLYTVEIIDMNNLGAGICKIDGKVVFVRGGVTLDKLEIGIIKNPSKKAYIADSALDTKEHVSNWQIQSSVNANTGGNPGGEGWGFATGVYHINSCNYVLVDGHVEAKRGSGDGTAGCRDCFGQYIDYGGFINRYSISEKPGHNPTIFWD